MIVPRFLRRRRGMTALEAYSAIYPRRRLGIDVAPIRPPRSVQGPPNTTTREETSPK